MKKKFLFIALSLTLIFSFTALPSFAADDSSVVDMLPYLVDSVEKTINMTNVYVPSGTQFDFLINTHSGKFSLNNANSILLSYYCRDTIQFAFPVDNFQSPFGYVDIRAQIDFSDGSTAYSNWVTVFCDNNNPYSPDLPRWSITDDEATFDFVFDIRGKSNVHIVSISSYQVFHPYGGTDHWSFWMRSQPVQFSVVYNSTKDLIDAIGGATDDITDSIDKNGDKVSDAIDKQTQDLLDATVPGFGSSMNNQNKAEQQLSSGFNSLSSMVDRPDMSLDDLSSFTSSFTLIASGIGSIFNSFGGKFRIVWNALVFFGGAALLLGIAVPVAGLASKASRSGSKSQTFKSQKGAKKD